MDKTSLLKVFKSSGFNEIDELLATDLNNIVKWQEVLKNINVDNIEPMFSTINEEDCFISNKDVSEREKSNIMHNAPDKDGDFFLVPKIIKK